MKAYVVKSAFGSIQIHFQKPSKSDFFGSWESEDYIQITSNDLPKGINPSWEDKEPIEIELKISKPKK